MKRNSALTIALLALSAAAVAEAPGSVTVSDRGVHMSGNATLRLGRGSAVYDWSGAPTHIAIEVEGQDGEVYEVLVRVVGAPRPTPK